MTAACRACGARVLLCVTPAGKPIAVDPEPSPQGNLFLRSEGSLATAYEVTWPDAVKHREHACPQGAERRKR